MGLNILRVIDEPTAAAIAYGLHRVSDGWNVLILDLSGGPRTLRCFEPSKIISSR